jgi:hypothetical protein
MSPARRADAVAVHVAETDEMTRGIGNDTLAGVVATLPGENVGRFGDRARSIPKTPG